MVTEKMTCTFQDGPLSGNTVDLGYEFPPPEIRVGVPGRSGVYRYSVWIPWGEIPQAWYTWNPDIIR